MRRLLDSGVIVEVDAVDHGFRLALVHPDRTAEWIVSPAEAEALMEALMIETIR